MKRINLTIYIIFFIGLWTLTITFATYRSIVEIIEYSEENIAVTAKISYEKDILYRKWVSMQGGVYVRISNHTPPNPYLTFIDNRDVVTTKGDSLTLVNPAYMSRQIYEFAKKDYNVTGHLSSFKPINPINTPNKIEKQALLAFEKGDTLFTKNDTVNGKPYLRYIRPFITEQSCLKCHASQGYKVGDIRGAICVAVPIEGFTSTKNEHIKTSIENYLLIWIIGAVVIIVIMFKLKKQIKALQIADETIIQRNAELYEKNIELNNQAKELIQLTNNLEQANKEIKESEMLLSETGKIAKVGGWKIDIATQQLTCSKEVYHIYEIPENYELTIDKGISFYDNNSVEIVQKAINEAMLVGNPFDVEVGIITAKGNKLTIQAIGKTQYDVKGNPETVIGTFQDITERKQSELIIGKQNEELKKLNTDKDRFITIISHDLKSPFNSILGFLDLLTENIHNYDIDKIEKQLIIVNNSAKNTFKLLEDILMWVRANSGKVSFLPQKIVFNEMCEEIISSLIFNAKAKSITINCIEHENIILSVDIDMFKIILRNLISNAIKYTNENGKISVYAVQTPTDTVITVSDNGIGIDKNNQKKLWSLTEQYTTTGTADESGTGFGLTLCKEFVEKHNGKIWVESELGKGSDFKFTIPFGHEL